MKKILHCIYFHRGSKELNKNNKILLQGQYLMPWSCYILKSYFYNKDIQKLQKETISLKQQMITLTTQKDLIEAEKRLYEDIVIKNSVIKTSVKNLLDLIPDPITLDKFLLSKNRLIIYGITPTKDIYNMLMLPPLESIFEKTTTYFYELPNGWYRFKSINIIKAKKDETAIN